MGCDIHSLLVVRNENNNVVTPVVSTLNIGNTVTRVEPCNFRDYFVFGLLTDGSVRSSGIEGINLPFKGKYPHVIDRSGDNATDAFVKAYMDTEGYDYHSHTYVTMDELVRLCDALYRERNKCAQVVGEETYRAFLELDCAYSAIRRLTDYMNDVKYNLWEQDVYDNHSVELLLMFDS